MVTRWTVARSHLIPIVFHWVLAAYLWVRGRLWKALDALALLQAAGGDGK